MAPEVLERTKPTLPVERSSAPRLFQPVSARQTSQAEWVEVRVKSVLNAVKGMPFRWSINPYRGCAFACRYCLHGETPILMADGTWKALQEIRPGDAVYGTARAIGHRRYVKTRVLAHWATEKPAYRITLEDGTEIVASGDHRFLSNRGWKFVTGAESGRFRRPHLTTGNRLIGVGAFAHPFAKGEDYKRGYLCGMIRGDGLLATFRDSRNGRRSGDVHQFRLALVDEAALRRTEAFLREFAIPTRDFLFQPARHGFKPVWAIGSASRSHVETIRHLIAWPPERAPTEWHAGFLAGIFDAEGGYSRGTLRIANTDLTVIDWVEKSLARLGYAAVLERRSNDRNRPVHVIRLPGGLKRHLRLFHTVDPAIIRKRDITGQALWSARQQRIVAIEPIGRRALFDITTGTGDFIANGVVSHNCFARVTHWYLDQDGVSDWSSRIFVKVNAPEVLRRELARPTWKREQVHIGTATDPYQPAEGTYRLTRRILEALRDFRTPVALVTKSAMVVRDIDVLRQLAAGPGAFVFLTVTTVDPALARELEPNAPPPQRRLEALRALADAGIRTGVLLAPVLPGITDDEEHLAAVVAAAKEYGASALSTNTLYLTDVPRRAFFQYLEHRRPELIPEYERLYKGAYAPRATQQRIEEVVAALKARLGFPTSRPRIRPPGGPEPSTPAQLRLL